MYHNIDKYHIDTYINEYLTNNNECLEEWNKTIKYRFYKLFNKQIFPSKGWIYQYKRIQNRNK